MKRRPVARMTSSGRSSRMVRALLTQSSDSSAGGGWAQLLRRMAGVGDGVLGVAGLTGSVGASGSEVTGAVIAGVVGATDSGVSGTGGSGWVSPLSVQQRLLAYPEVMVNSRMDRL